jgi:hypothetical protein
LASQLTQRVASFKRAGDCALLPGVMSLSDRVFADGFNHCPNWHRIKSHAQVERELRAFCRTNSAVATRKQSPSNEQSAPSQAAAPADPAALPKSASCSNITGTKGGVPAATECKTGNSLLAAARAVRAQNPAAAAETYKQAAEAYRRAGDVALATTILQEALTIITAAPSSAPQPQSGPTAPPPAASAASPIGPQAALNNSADCSTITGPGMGPTGPCEKPKPGFNPPQPSPGGAAQTPPPPVSSLRTVLLPPPPCDACMALDAVAEILPQLGQALDQADQEINSPNIPPPQEWLTEPPRGVSTRQALNAQPAEDAGDPPADTARPIRLPPGFSLDDPFQLEAEAEKDYAQRCKEAFGEFLSGKDNPIEGLKKKIRDLKKQGNSTIDIVRHPFDSAKDWLQGKIDEKLAQIDPRNYFKILEEHIRKAETKDHQEELKRFKEKWAEKCVENAYTKDIEEQLKHALDDSGDDQ